jgi:hypothetical protein
MTEVVEHRDGEGKFPVTEYSPRMIITEISVVVGVELDSTPAIDNISNSFSSSGNYMRYFFCCVMDLLA